MSTYGRRFFRKTFKAKQEEPPKPLEAKQEEAKPEAKKSTKKEQNIKSTNGFVSANALQEKKKELELRLAYATEEHNPEGLRKIIAQNKESEIKLVSKVQMIMQSHEEKLNERMDAERWMDWCSSTLGAPMTTVFWQLVRTPVEKRDMKAVADALKTCGELFGMLETHLAGRQFVAGDRFTERHAVIKGLERLAKGVVKTGHQPDLIAAQH